MERAGKRGAVVKSAIQARVERHGRELLAIFPRATEKDPVKLCQKLRRWEKAGEVLGLRMCNGPQYSTPEAKEAEGARILKAVNDILGNVRDNAPKTGSKCSCKRGQERDNCAACEGSGMVIDFKAIRSMPRIVPVILNRDPRGYALKIDDEWMRAHRDVVLHRDWGGYGIIAPDLTEND